MNFIAKMIAYFVYPFILLYNVLIRNTQQKKLQASEKRLERALMAYNDIRMDKK